MRGSLAAALALVGLTAAPAAAGADTLLTAEDVGPGDCFPTVVLSGQLVDCSYPIPEGRSLDLWGPHHADIDLSYDEDNDEHPPCFVGEDRLLCPGVFVYYSTGERRITPVISGVAAGAGAIVSVVDAWSEPASLSPEWGGEPYVFPGNPLRVWVDGSQRTEARFAAIRSRDDGRLMATIDLPGIVADDYAVISLDTGDLPPGRYVVTPCLGESRVRCREVAGGVSFQVGTGRLREVIDGWNRASADRINVVFAPSGATEPDAALTLIRSLLGWEGPLPIGADDAVVTDARSREVWWVQYGPFAIEPLRSSRDAFNLWILDDVLAQPRALDHTAPPMGWDRPPPGFGLPDVAITAFDVQYPGEYARSEALWPSFSTPDGPVTISRDGLVFASSYLAVYPSYPRSQAATLAHEWGHALFDLRDEYVDPERGVTHGYPNCAPDEATAKAWWGDLLGTVDPFLSDYVSVLTGHGVWVDPGLRDRVVTTLVSGGCYSASPRAVRPSVDSIMNSEIPVFGSVNRRRVEEVLALWSGRAPFAVDAVGVDCDVVVRRERVGFCSVEIARYVDPPADLVVVITDVERLRCDPAVAVGEVYRAHCGVLRLPGEGPWEATVTVAGESTVVTVTTG